MMQIAIGCFIIGYHFYSEALLGQLQWRKSNNPNLDFKIASLQKSIVFTGKVASTFNLVYLFYIWNSFKTVSLQVLRMTFLTTWVKQIQL